jgi:hypothetical protein
MTPDGAELTAPVARSPFAARAYAGYRPLAARLERLLADAERRAAVRDSWRALWLSRAFVWAASIATVLAAGYGPTRGAFDPPGVTSGFGSIGNLLAAPAARWDSAWYLTIAEHGYLADLGARAASRVAFFPLYPFGIRAIGALGVPYVLAGVLLSLVAFAAALYGIHRLATLELSRLRSPALDRDGVAEAARLAVLLTAFAPMAFYFSAVYSESLFLALSVGVFLAARHGRWWLVGLLGALACATRSTGLVLLLPALLIYLYGPREDRLADRPDRARARRLALRPRYRLRRDSLWLAALPLGLLAYSAGLALAGGSALAPFSAQDDWGRHLAAPYSALWDGVKAALEGARQLLSFQREHVYFPAAHGSPFVSAGHNLTLLAFALLALPLLVGVLRHLPLAYGAYVIAALALPLSEPASEQPLMSLPRFLLVLFPLSIWLAAWLVERPRARAPVLGGSALALAVFVAQFATWHWVA